jgi:hypothetical protein
MENRDYGASHDVSNSVRYFTAFIGAIYLIVGLVGFIPAFRGNPPADAPSLSVTSQYGYLLGLFPINILHNLVHLVIGIAGLLCFRRTDTAINYCRALAILYLVLAVMGLFPVLRTTFKLIPLFGHDIWLHAATAVIAAFFGWVATRQTGTTRAAGTA